ncbi:hypothetical protein R3P38DRAFT_3475965 [Favolaschia claudopus]|uniref:Uncharacterized protein n=1 Tax=Favolaschia claudopus TaxID=2862362 RepID=A0AAW0CIF4_9AGAR
MRDICCQCNAFLVLSSIIPVVDGYLANELEFGRLVPIEAYQIPAMSHSPWSGGRRSRGEGAESTNMNLDTREFEDGEGEVERVKGVVLGHWENRRLIRKRGSQTKERSSEREQGFIIAPPMVSRSQQHEAPTPRMLGRLPVSSSPPPGISSSCLRSFLSSASRHTRPSLDCTTTTSREAIENQVRASRYTRRKGGRFHNYAMFSGPLDARLEYPPARTHHSFLRLLRVVYNARQRDKQFWPPGPLPPLLTHRAARRERGGVLLDEKVPSSPLGSLEEGIIRDVFVCGHRGASSAPPISLLRPPRLACSASLLPAYHACLVSIGENVQYRGLRHPHLPAHVQSSLESLQSRARSLVVVDAPGTSPTTYGRPIAGGLFVWHNRSIRSENTVGVRLENACHDSWGLVRSCEEALTHLRRQPPHRASRPPPSNAALQRRRRCRLRPGVNHNAIVCGHSPWIFFSITTGCLSPPPERMCPPSPLLILEFWPRICQAALALAVDT